jgi:putative FmdB family regulatory protein
MTAQCILLPSTAPTIANGEVSDKAECTHSVARIGCSSHLSARFLRGAVHCKKCEPIEYNVVFSVISAVFSAKLTRSTMPIYEYRCSACQFEKDALQKMADAPLVDCPNCGKPALVKLVSAAGFQLKGSGWYATDFKGSGSAKAADKPKPDGAAAATEGSNSAATEAGGSKPAEASSSKSESAAPPAPQTPGAGD